MGWWEGGLRRKATPFKCHVVFLTTLCLQERELSQGLVLFCGRGLICPSAFNKDVSMKGPPTVARGGLWVPCFQVTPSCEAKAVPHRAQSSGFGGNKGPLFPSVTTTAGRLEVGEGQEELGQRPANPSGRNVTSDFRSRQPKHVQPSIPGELVSIPTTPTPWAGEEDGHGRCLETPSQLSCPGLGR